MTLTPKNAGLLVQKIVQMRQADQRELTIALLVSAGASRTVAELLVDRANINWALPEAA